MLIGGMQVCFPEENYLSSIFDIRLMGLSIARNAKKTGSSETKADFEGPVDDPA